MDSKAIARRALGRSGTRESPAAAIRERLKRRKPHERPISWPGGDSQVIVRLLSLAERIEALDAARASLKERGLVGNEDALEVTLTAESLAVAIRELDGARLFRSRKELEEGITEDEQVALAAEYAELRRDADPTMIAADVQQAISEAVASRDRYRLIDLAEQLPRQHLLALVAAVLDAGLTPAAASGEVDA